MVVLLGASCRERPSSGAASASAPPLSPSAPRELSARRVSSEIAFDLIATGDGAALVWGEAASVMVAPLDGKGAALGEPIKIASPEAGTVSEISAASIASRMAVSWTLRGQAGASNWGALGDLATRAFAAPLALGASVLGDPGQRGGIALAPSDKGEFFVLRRGPDEACHNEPGKTCAGFGFTELLTTGAESRGLPMAVPAVCSRPISGFVRVSDRWHYALCSNEDGHSLTTAFMRQPQPFYVDVQRVLGGCTPLGMIRIGDQAILAGACNEGRRAVGFGGLGSKPRTIDIEQVAITCERGFPRLRSIDDGLNLRLDQARDGLSALLPPTIAPANARAAWTGTSLLVATWVRGTVSLRRFECRGAELQRAE